MEPEEKRQRFDKPAPIAEASFLIQFSNSQDTVIASVAKQSTLASVLPHGLLRYARNDSKI
jgi:hypothetical protein